MKIIISIYAITAIGLMSFTTVQQAEFYDFFKNAYAQSFSGLETLKDAKGAWPDKSSVKNFDVCEFSFNKERNVEEMVLRKVFTSETSSTEMMASIEKELNVMLPEWQYKRVKNRNADGTQAISYIYNSEDLSVRATYPTVDLDVVKREGTWEILVRLFEPGVTRK